MLTHEDFAGRKFPSDMSPFEDLVEAGSVALEKFIENHMGDPPLLVEQEIQPSQGSRFNKAVEGNNNRGKKREIPFLVGCSSKKKQIDYDFVEKSKPVQKYKVGSRMLKESPSKEFNFALNNPNSEIEMKLTRNTELKKKSENVVIIMPVEVKAEIEKIGGYGELLVIQKRLTKSDVEISQARLSIPRSQIREKSFITEEEKLLLNGAATAIEAILIEPSLLTSKITLKGWKSSTCYQLTRNWNSIIHHNNLVKGDMIQLWSFRINSGLCFALVVER